MALPTARDDADMMVVRKRERLIELTTWAGVTSAYLRPGQSVEPTGPCPPLQLKATFRNYEEMQHLGCQLP